MGQLSEWDTVTAVDKGVWCWSSNQVASVTCTTNPTAFEGDLALSMVSSFLESDGTSTFSPAAGFTPLADNGAVSTALHYHLSYRLGVPISTPVTATVGGATGRWAGVLVTFH